MRKSVLTLACLGLAACATAPGPYQDLAYQRVQPGSRLTLNEPLQIPAGQAHVDLQAVGSGEMDPYCVFEVSTLSESPQTVEPDTFEIYEVGRSISPSNYWGMQGPVMLAGVGIGIGIGTGYGYGGWLAGPDSAPTQLFYKTRLWLRSVTQPNVMKMTCQWDQMTASGAAFARHLTVAEIRQALGKTFALTLAGAPVPAR
jgi:hypothetical protein